MYVSILILLLMLPGSFFVATTLFVLLLGLVARFSGTRRRRK